MLRLSTVSLLAAVLTLPSASMAADLKIVSWNIGAGFPEQIANRTDELVAMDVALEPDVLVLIEVASVGDVHQIAAALEWDSYYAAVSDFGLQRLDIHFFLEVAVLSKVPIVSVIEYDAGPDGRFYDVFTSDAPDGDPSIPVGEEELSGVAQPFGTPAGSDRGTLRVDIEGGLTVFPVHLKSNSNSVCFAAFEAGRALDEAGVPRPPLLAEIEAIGSAKKLEDDKANAMKRERVMSAVKQVADEAVSEGRTVIIAGDYNTAYEDGKAGSDPEDCTLAMFGCARAPFDPAMCSDGDGFDDTLAALTIPLVGTEPWAVLTKDLGRTFDDEAFADKAIDHFAVPVSQEARFVGADKATETFGSDHYPIHVTFSQ